MIENKSDYEWGNMCANSMKVVDCSNYLKTYKKIEMYKNYVDQMNKTIDTTTITKTNVIDIYFSPPFQPPQKILKA